MLKKRKFAVSAVVIFLLALANPAYAGFGWISPVDCPISQVFGDPNPEGGEAHHTGIDYKCVVGTPVRAPTAGIVLYAGVWSVAPGYGNTLWIDTGIGSDGRHVIAFFAHLRGVANDITVGSYVSAGQIVSYTGDSGVGTGPHLHFGVARKLPTDSSWTRWDEDGTWDNPADYLGQNAQARIVQGNLKIAAVMLALVGLITVAVLAVKQPASIQSIFHGIEWTFRKGYGVHYWVSNAVVGVSFRERKFGRAAIAAGVWMGVLIAIPLTALATLSVITGGQVYATWLPSPSGQISPIFTPEVQTWATEIEEWSRMYNLDENLVATIMQIESCGNASAVSRSGAQGLFQVMPFHFVPGEDMQDPETNAHRGLRYLQQTIAAYPGDIGRAMAAYNGGIAGVNNPDISSWPLETQRYYYYGSGIYADALSGASSSTYLSEWLAIDAGRLCPSTLKERTK